MVEVTITAGEYSSKYNHNIKHHLASPYSYPITISELESLSGVPFPIDQITDTPLHTYSEVGVAKCISELYNAPPDFGNNSPQNSSDSNVIVEENDVILANGSLGADVLTFEALLGPGDHAITTTPTYQELFSVPESLGAETTHLPLHEENQWLPDISELKAAIKSNTKLLILNNPNNPLGSILPESLLLEIIEIVKEKDIWILCDEVFRPTYHSTDIVPPSILHFGYEKAISTGSSSKAFSAMGLRLGWIASKNKEFIKMALDKRGMNGHQPIWTTCVIMKYILDSKVRDKLIERNYKLARESLAVLSEGIESSNGKLTWVKPAAGNTSLIKVTGVTNTLAMCVELAQKYGVLVTPGEVFGYPGYIRVSYICPSESMKAGFEAIMDYLNKY
ncbi:hypothetical protein DAMA08_011070 [Martiniozyma asiatica (nom. inval.)]|nr:hypothetical protein DAMA08_011070 [Martiniozyma asiatica]